MATPETAALNPTDAEREQLSAIDTAWYRMESPENHANIGGVLIFDEPLDFERLREVVDERLVGQFPRFRQRVVESSRELTRPYWEEDPDFDLDHHIERTSLPEPGDREELRPLANRIMTRGLDLERPLWKLHLIENFRGGSALIAQLHHCLGDGFALARVLLSIADEGYGLEAPMEQEGTGRANHLAHQSLSERLYEEIREHTGSADELRELGRDVAELLRSIGHILLMPYDETTRLKAPLTGDLEVAWSQTYSLEEFKRIAHELGHTVNDLLMAGVTAAVRGYLADSDEEVDTFDLRALVPVNLRPARSIEEMEAVLGNEFGLVFLDLPIRASNLEERLSSLEETIEQLKHSSEAIVGFGVLSAEGWAPAPVEQFVNEIFARKASLVVSNVPGPKKPLRIAGCELESLMFWVPHPAPRVGLGISLISYAGRVDIGVRADRAVVDDAQAFVGRIEAAFDELKAHAEAQQ